MLTMQKKKATLQDLTMEQAAALTEFRLNNGPDWKEKLLAGWMIAAFPGPLQQIRNDLGPAWLDKLEVQ
jgi:hypothetical protein